MSISVALDHVEYRIALKDKSLARMVEAIDASTPSGIVKNTGKASVTDYVTYNIDDEGIMILLTDDVIAGIALFVGNKKQSKAYSKIEVKLKKLLENFTHIIGDDIISISSASSTGTGHYIVDESDGDTKRTRNQLLARIMAIKELGADLDYRFEIADNNSGRTLVYESIPARFNLEGCKVLLGYSLKEARTLDDVMKWMKTMNITGEINNERPQV